MDSDLMRFFGIFGAIGFIAGVAMPFWLAGLVVAAAVAYYAILVWIGLKKRSSGVGIFISLGGYMIVMVGVSALLTSYFLRPAIIRFLF